MTARRADEGPHVPSPFGAEGWSERWSADFATQEGELAGWVRFELFPGLGLATYHACLSGSGRRVVAVSDLEVSLPRRSGSLEVRSHGLWAEHIPTHPLEVFQVANEVHGVAVDDPDDLYRADGARGDVTAMAFDLDYETDGDPVAVGADAYAIPCRVLGEVLVGDEEFQLDCPGRRSHAWGRLLPVAFPGADGEVVARTGGLVLDAAGAVHELERSLCRLAGGGYGWSEVTRLRAS